MVTNSNKGYHCVAIIVVKLKNNLTCKCLSKFNDTIGQMSFDKTYGQSLECIKAIMNLK